MTKIKIWIEAFRLRTLPLSVSGIILGSLLALSINKFDWTIFTLAFTTTLFLQILSNLANDFGDFVSGKDNENRIGPARTMQSGKIKKAEMITLIIIFTVFSLITGIWLIIEGTKELDTIAVFTYLGLGIGAIIAAMKYTMGKNPYGYRGLGDLFVFIFFGLVAVMGTYFLHTNELGLEILLPASTIGLMSVAVLNMNNLRDYTSDKESGKKTIVVMIGQRNGKLYQLIILTISQILPAIYIVLTKESLWSFMYLLCVPILFKHILFTFKNTQPLELDPELKKIALTTLLFTILFGLFINLF
jgi:1,4-dihydroxy-2-naphthoate octaprenyltransferase